MMDDGSDDHDRRADKVGAPTRPKLRGVLHQWAALTTLGAGTVLVRAASSGRARAAVLVFAISLLMLFTVSATYHRVNWSPRARARMRRLDHASIFVLIAGTYTPIALLALPEAAGRSVVTAAWAMAFIGVLQSLFWIRAPKPVTAVLAVAAGWTLVPYWGAVHRALPAVPLALIAGGGIAYTLGAVVYAIKRPNPAPLMFGYHEVFHALTIVGAGLHYGAVLELVLAP
jgi:hemolysin III